MENFDSRTVLNVANVEIPGRVFLAPMAGITDLPYRRICRAHGAAYAVAEMVASQAQLRTSRKSQERFNLKGEQAPRGIQLLGCFSQDLADSARYAAECGAQIIDLNCGCPAKKVCSVASGAALLANEDLVKELLEAMVSSVSGPVTLKYRTGTDEAHINAVRIAKMAESVGVQMLTLHGRTRAQAFRGEAEYETIRQVKQAVGIPVIANGDVFSPKDALDIQKRTGCDGIMIGRGIFGNPWLFQQCAAALRGEPIPPRPPLAQRIDTVVRQIEMAAEQKGERIACLEARKHFAWYLKGIPYAGYYKEQISHVETLEGLYAIAKGIKRDLKDGD